MPVLLGKKKMPCNSDYMGPSDRERALQKTAQLYAHALKGLGYPVPPEVSVASRDHYCSADFVPALCSLLKSLSEEDLDKVVYNARDRTSRELATWWEDHLAADKAREAREAAERQRQETVKKAKAKLTKAEKKALGLE